MALKKFTVTHDALTLTTAKDRADRFMRGAVLELEATEDRVKSLVKARALVETSKLKDGEPLPRPSLVSIMRGFGADGDPVKAPTEISAPVDDTKATQASK